MKAFTHNPLCINEKRLTGEAVKAKNENLLTRAHVRAFIFLQADATFLIVVGKSTSRIKSLIFTSALFHFRVSICFCIFAKS